MNQTLKSAIPIGLISAVLMALLFLGFSFFFVRYSGHVMDKMAEKQKTDMDALQTSYQEQMQKLTDRIVARVDETNKTLDQAIAARNTDLFLTQEENRKIETEKVNALADAVMTRLNKVIPTPEETDRGYNTVSQRVSDRLNPILSEIARTGNLTRSDVEFYASQISGLIDGVLKEELAEKQRLNNNVLTTATIAQDSLRLSQEMSALYIASLKDDGVLSRILSLPVRVVQDVSTLSIVGSSEKKRVEQRLFNELNALEQRLSDVQAQMPKAKGTETTTAPAAESAPAAPVRARPTPPPTASTTP